MHHGPFRKGRAVLRVIKRFSDFFPRGRNSMQLPCAKEQFLGSLSSPPVHRVGRLTDSPSGDTGLEDGASCRERVLPGGSSAANVTPAIKRTERLYCLCVANRAPIRGVERGEEKTRPGTWTIHKVSSTMVRNSISIRSYTFGLVPVPVETSGHCPRLGAQWGTSRDVGVESTESEVQGGKQDCMPRVCLRPAQETISVFPIMKMGIKGMRLPQAGVVFSVGRLRRMFWSGCRCRSPIRAGPRRENGRSGASAVNGPQMSCKAL